MRPPRLPITSRVPENPHPGYESELVGAEHTKQKTHKQRIRARTHAKHDTNGKEPHEIRPDSFGFS